MGGPQRVEPGPEEWWTKPIEEKGDGREQFKLHVRNFLDCVKSRKEPNAPVETGVAAAAAGHIGNLALTHGGQITWPLKAS